MGIYRLTFIDEIGIKPIKEYTLNCDIDRSEIEDAVALLNATKWRTSLDLKSTQKSIRSLKKCNLLKEKHILLGGFTGGPIGRRDYTFPAIYENPSNDNFKPDGKVECKQEGSHMVCSLDPKVL